MSRTFYIRNRFAVSFFLMCASLQVQAGNALSVSPTGGITNPIGLMSNTGRLGVTQRTTNADVTVQIRGSCYPTNLRGVANPISPSSTVVVSGKISIDGGSPQDFKFQIPSQFVVGGGLSASQTTNLSLTNSSGLPSGSQLAVSGNTVVLRLANAVKNVLDPVTATIDKTEKVISVSDVRFDQIATPNPAAPSYADYQNYAAYASARGNYVHPYADYSAQIVNKTYLAKDGPLSGSVAMTKSADGKLIDVEASFPGEAMYCGGYYSPLMVFFDEKRPKFGNIVSFDMGTGLPTYWPEKEHAGYFLVLPHKGKVLSKNELFGEEQGFLNGFQKLAIHDKNKDGVIDSKDAVFKRLRLWKDNSGQGLYRAQDSIPLSAKVKSIKLQYRSQIERAEGHAEFREKSTVDLISARLNNKRKTASEVTTTETAEIVDVWFEPAPKK